MIKRRTITSILLTLTLLVVSLPALAFTSYCTISGGAFGYDGITIQPGAQLTVFKVKSRSGTVILNQKATYTLLGSGAWSPALRIEKNAVAYIYLNAPGYDADKINGSPFDIPTSDTATLASLSATVDFPSEVAVAIPPASITVATSTKASLSSGDATGSITYVTDDVRGAWQKSSAGYFSLSGERVNVKEFGAKGDVKTSASGGSMSSSSATLTCSDCGFASTDVGKKIDVSGCGASASDTQGVTARHNQVGTISAFTNSTTVTVSFTAAATVSSLAVTFGTDDSTAIASARSAKGAGSVLYFPRGSYAVNSEVALASGMSVCGDGPGVTNLYWVGPTRNSGSGTVLFSIADGVHDVTIYDLSIIGTNKGAIGVTSVGGLYAAVKPATGAGAAISNLTFRNLDIGYLWGFGFRSDGDSGDQSGSAATVINTKILDCSIHHNADNGINLNTGGGLLIRGCHIADNGKAGIEFAGSRLRVVDNYVARNKNAGIAPGGLGNPSLGKDILVRGNLIERNGSAGNGAGIAVGGNIVHAIISHNIVRENELEGIHVGEGNPDFSNLSRDIRITSNQIISNGAVFPAYGITVSIDDVIIENNDIFDDLASGYAQYYGILCKGDGVKLLRNRVRNNTGFDYEFIQNSNSLLDRDDRTGTIQQLDGNGWTGTADTSSATATYKTGKLFSPRWVGVPIKINSVRYLITAVTAAPSGNFTVSGLTVTRTSGTNFSSAWAGQYIRLGASLYFLIASVADASHLTISNGIGNTIPSSGAWVLNGSVSLTLDRSAGTQTGVDFVIPPHVVYNTGTVSEQLITTATVSANVGSKQPLFMVPSGMHLIVTRVVARNTSTSLAAIGDGLTFGFDSGASDYASAINQGQLAMLTGGSLAVGSTFAVNGGNAAAIGSGGDIFGCIFNDTSITATVVIDVFGYLY